MSATPRYSFLSLSLISCSPCLKITLSQPYYGNKIFPAVYCQGGKLKNFSPLEAAK